MEQTELSIHVLNDLYTQYSQGLIDKKQFEGLLFEIILEDLRYFNLYRWKKDECMEFLSWLYPRLSRAVDSYNKNGATFESYLGTLIRWSAREYRTRQAIHNTAEHAVWLARYSEMYAREEEPEYYEQDEGKNAKKTGTKTVRNPRQMLILILKCYHYLSDDMLDRLAPRAGISKKALKEMVEKIRIQRIQHDEMASHMKERIHSQYYRCIVYEKRLAAISENSLIYAHLKKQLQKARQRLDAMRKRLAKFRMEATNGQVADAIGIKKGTVDSNLHTLKNRLKSGPPPQLTPIIRN